MLNVQTIALECPKSSKVAYELSIPLTGFSPDVHEVSIIGPGGQDVPHSSTDEGVQFGRCDGPGVVARFTAEVRDKSENAEVKDRVTIEVVVLPETEPAVRDAIGAVISEMKVQISGASHFSSDTASKAFQLQKSFGEMAAVELLRRLAFDRSDTITVLRPLLLLRDMIGRPTAQWLPRMVFAVTSELAGSISHFGTADTLLDVLERLALPPHEKWFYLIRAAQELQRARGRVFSLLSKITPADNRTETASAVLEMCELVVDGRQQACELFQEFCWAPAAPRVLEWMEADRSVISAGCGFLIKVDDKTAAQRLRSLFERSDMGGDYYAIANCLATWQDREAVPAILRKLAGCHMVYADDLVRALLRFGAEVVPQIQKIQQESGPDKAKRIQEALAAK